MDGWGWTDKNSIGKLQRHLLDIARYIYISSKNARMRPFVPKSYHNEMLSRRDNAENGPRPESSDRYINEKLIIR